MAELRIGTSGWNYKHWRHRFYPDDVPVRRWLEYYQQFLKERGDDPGLREELAQTYANVGDINSALGAQTRALEAYGHALELYQDLARAQDVPLRHLHSPATDKEAAALQLAQRQPDRRGRVAVLSCVESCSTYRLRTDAQGLVQPRKDAA